MAEKIGAKELRLDHIFGVFKTKDVNYVKKGKFCLPLISQICFLLLWQKSGSDGRWERKHSMGTAWSRNRTRNEPQSRIDPQICSASTQNNFQNILKLVQHTENKGRYLNY